jgi:1-acyl-sn-glycerol-3-phosphate acyltransferase
MKSFKEGGIATILKKVPNALVVPIAIQNSWRMQRYGGFPADTFVSLTWDVLAPIEPNDRLPEEIVQEAERAIREKIGQA